MSRLLLSLLLSSSAFADAPRLDRLGDPLPPGAAGRLGSSRFRTGPTRPAEPLAPDGRTLACGDDERAWFWDVTTGRPRSIVTFDKPGRVRIVALSPDSQRFAAVLDNTIGQIGGPDIHNETLLIAEIDSGKVLCRRHMGTESLHCAYFSSDGKFLLCYLGDRLLLDTATGTEVRPLRADTYALATVGGLMAERADNRVRICEVETGRPVVALENSGGDLSDLTFSPDGRALAACTTTTKARFVAKEPNTVHIWDTATGKKRCRIDNLPLWIGGLVFSQDSRLLAARAGQDELFVWEAASGRELVRIPVKTRFTTPDGQSVMWPFHFAFSPDSKYVYWNEGRNTICRLEVHGGKESRYTSPLDVTDFFALSRDGKDIVLGGRHSGHGSGGSVMVVADARTGSVRPWCAGHLSPIRKLVFSPDGKTLASLDEDGIFRLWNVASRASLPLGSDEELPHTDEFQFAPDGQTLTVVRIVRTEKGSIDHSIVQAWHLDRGLRPRPGWTWRLASGYSRFAPDGRTVALINENEEGTLQLLDLKTGRLLHAISAHQGRIWQSAFQAGGRLLITRGEDDFICVWDVATGRELKRMLWPQKEGGGLACSDDGKMLATVRGNELQEWNLVNDRLLWRHRLKAGSFPGQLAFSGDGRKVAALVKPADPDGAKHMRAWEAASGQSIPKADPHPENGKSQFLRGPNGEIMTVDYGEPGVDVIRPAFSGKVVGRLTNPTNTFFFVSHGAGKTPVEFWDPRNAKTLAYRRTPFVCRGRAIAVLDEDVEWWDTKEGRRFAGLALEELGGGRDMAVSPDGNTLATGGRNGTIVLWELGPANDEWPPQLLKYAPSELEELWAQLAVPRSQVHAALAMAASPAQALPFLTAKLRVLPRPDPARTTRLIADLDSDDFDKRETATWELASLGKVAEAELRKALSQKPSAEKKRRIDELFDSYHAGEYLSPEMHRAAGAIRALELLGTDSAREELKRLADGPKDAWLTQEAAAALRRTIQTDRIK